MTCFPGMHDRKVSRDRSCRAGFSLVEIVLALGVVSFALIAILGLIPIGLDAMRSSVDSTVSSLIFNDVRERIEGLPLKSATLDPIYYDARGLFTDGSSNAYYRADVTIAPPYQAPTNTHFMSARVSLAWPVAPDGTVSPKKSGTATSSFYVTALTAPGWQNIDTNFIPQIDF